MKRPDQEADKAQRRQVGSALVADGENAGLVGFEPAESQSCKKPEWADKLVMAASHEAGMAGTSAVM